MSVTSTIDSDFDDEDFESEPSRRGYVDLSHWKYFFSDPEDNAREDWWMRHGKCFKDTSLTEYFVPTLSYGGEGEDDKEDRKEARRRTNIAKAICNGTKDGKPCQVRGLCGSYAILNQLWEGVWGGMSKRERRLAARRGDHLKVLPVAVAVRRGRRAG